MDCEENNEAIVRIDGRDIDLTPVIKEIDNPLRAMKIFREITGYGLRESQIYIDSYRFTGRFPKDGFICNKESKSLDPGDKNNKNEDKHSFFSKIFKKKGK